MAGPLEYRLVIAILANDDSCSIWLTEKASRPENIRLHALVVSLGTSDYVQQPVTFSVVSDVLHPP